MNARELHVFYALKRAYRRGANGETPPAHAEVRDVLGELDAARSEVQWIKTAEQLEELPRNSVIRDNECRVLERWPAGWWVTGEEGLSAVDLPAQVLYLPEEQGS